MAVAVHGEVDERGESAKLRGRGTYRPFRRTLVGSAILAVLVGASCARPAPAREKESSGDWRGRVAAGKTVYVRNLRGPVTITSGRGKDLVAVVRSRGTGMMDIVPHDGTVTICGFPDATDHTCRPRGTFRVRGGLRPGQDDQVYLRIEVPRGVKLDVSTVDGAIEMAGTTAETKVASVNGDLTVRGANALDAATVNGRIYLALPERSNVDLQAQTRNGSISSTLELRNATSSRHALRGTLGKGGTRLRLSTVNGPIDIRG